MITDARIRQFAEKVEAVANLEGPDRKTQAIALFHDAVSWLLPDNLSPTRRTDITHTLIELQIPAVPGDKDFYEITYPLGFDLLLAAQNAVQADTSLEPKLNQAFDALFANADRPVADWAKRPISEYVSEFRDTWAQGNPSQRPSYHVSLVEISDGIAAHFKRGRNH
jgi:hypothetical protein